MSECEIVATEVFVAGSDKTKYLCEVCKISFSKKSNLNVHLKKFHQLQVANQGNKTCALCNEKFRTMVLLLEHLQNQHSITLNFVSETFNIEKDFLDWKDKIEKESLSRFIFRTSTTDKEHDIKVTYYCCHRSGCYKMKQNRVRRVKASGSIKSGSTCPALIKVSSETIDGVSEIKVEYQSVHLGHDLETPTLILTKEERENLAACLKLGIPMDRILEEAKQNHSPTNRFKNLTRRHLHYIRKKYNIPLNNVPKTNALQNADVEEDDSSNVYEDYVETEASNHSEIQENENNTAVSSLLLLQNENHLEAFNNRKMQIINQLKELQTKVDEWDPLRPLPDVEDHIKAINARLDFSVPFGGALPVQEMAPIFAVSPPKKTQAKRRKISKTMKNSPKKNKLN